MPPSAKLRARAAFIAARVRPRRRVGLRPSEPRAALLRYEQVLEEIAVALRRATEILVLPFLGDFARTDEIRMDATDEEIVRVVGGLRVVLGHIVQRERVALPVAATAQAVDLHNAGEMTRTLRSIGVDAVRSTPELAAAVPAFVERNVSLIGGLADRQVDEVAELLRVAGPAGMRAETLARRIEERLGVTESRAAFIARDQVLKLNGQLTALRQVAAGVQRYVWDTSGDERVRESHADLDGTTQLWSDPPVVSEDGRRGHPGDDFGCRCVAIPMLDAGEQPDAVAPAPGFFDPRAVVELGLSAITAAGATLRAQTSTELAVAAGRVLREEPTRLFAFVEERRRRARRAV